VTCAPPAPTGAGEQLKIALVSPYDYPFPGGVTEHIGFLAAGLEARGHRVSILAPSSADREQLATDHVYRLGSIVRVPYHGSLARITLSLGLRQKVRALLERERFDIIHVHEPLLPMLPLVVLGESRTVTVATFHAYWKRCRFYALGRPILWPAFARLDGRIAVSEAAKQYVGRYFPGAYTIIPNGVDTTTFRPDLEPLPMVRGDGPCVLFVGRLEERKGFIHLLRAFVQVQQARPRRPFARRWCVRCARRRPLRGSGGAARCAQRGVSGSARSTRPGPLLRQRRLVLCVLYWWRELWHRAPRGLGLRSTGGVLRNRRVPRSGTQWL
jgi:glycosyltransferase involved in cell wall biosynthesis